MTALEFLLVLTISLLSDAFEDGVHVDHGNGSSIFFVPSLKAAAPLADLLFNEKKHYRYGLKGFTTVDVFEEIKRHDEDIMTKRLKFAWIDSASSEYAASITNIYFLSHIHCHVLKVDRDKKTISPEFDAEYWSNLVLKNNEEGLIDNLASLNQIIQGLNTKGGISIMGVFKENAKTYGGGGNVCKQVHAFRDFLMAMQIQGYALLSSALNYRGHHDAVHALAKVALERLKQQEAVLGGRYNDWYNYGKASCSYQIPMLAKQDKCIKVLMEKLSFLTELTPITVGSCNTEEPRKGEQWIYNKVSWQIVPRFNQSYCLQKHTDGYNNGIAIVLKKCQSHPVQNYNEKWVVDSRAGQIKLFADPNKCVTERNSRLVLWKCSKIDCTNCTDHWGNSHFNLHNKLTSVLLRPYGDLNLVTWMGLEIKSRS